MSDKIAKKKGWKKSLYILPILLILSFILIPIIDKQYGSTIRPDLTDFAVEDPEEVDKIFMASRKSANSNLLLEKNEKGDWIVNGKYPAEKAKVDLLIHEYMAKLKMKNPLPENALNKVKKDMAANAVKVEIYKDKRLYKTYYVGSNAADEMGTHMYLEGSARPFVVHIPGFIGYPQAMYNLNEKSWLSRNIFQTSILEIESIEVKYPGMPADSSFRIEKKDRKLELSSLGSASLPESKLDKQFLKQYAATFEKLSYEGFYEGLALKLADSVVNASKPYAVITVEDESGKKTLEVYQKPVTKESPKMDDEGNPANYDLDRYYAVINGDRSGIAGIQSFVFKNVFFTYGDFYH